MILLPLHRPLIFGDVPMPVLCLICPWNLKAPEATPNSNGSGRVLNLSITLAQHQSTSRLFHCDSHDLPFVGLSSYALHAY